MITQVSEWLKSPPAQVALACALVLTVGVIVFALVWSIVTNQPLNPIAGNLIAFLTGGGVTLIGGQVGAHHVTSGITQAVNLQRQPTP